MKDGFADMISFGTLSVANNDLPRKFKKGLKLNSIANAPQSELSTLLYGPGNVKEGYTDLTPFEAKNIWLSINSLILIKNY